MTIDVWLRTRAGLLTKSGIATAHLDALVLLEDIIGNNRSWLLAHPETTLKASALKKLESLIERRVAHEPLAYIRGKTEFYGREFFINHDVLEPRPESETMIDLLLRLYGKKETRVVIDLGTGSGALAITAKLEMPDLDVIGTDIDQACLKITRKNAKTLVADVKLKQGDLLQPLIDSNLLTFDSIILANLPYVPDSHTINQAAMQEPKIAIFGGEDGLDLYRQMFAQITTVQQKPTYVLTESLPFQHEVLRRIAKKSGYQESTEEDFIQLFSKI